MSNALTGKNSLAYMGTNARSPANIRQYDRMPTQNDYQNFSLGDFWLYIDRSVDPYTSHLYCLMSLADNVATWNLITEGSGIVSQLNGNSGTALPNDGVITVTGGTNITTTGSSNTLTIDLDDPVGIDTLVLPQTSTDLIGTIYMGLANYMHSYSSPSNIFVGQNSGNFTLTSVNTTALGINTGNALTSGSGNTFVGTNAGLLATSGASNVAVGSTSLDALTISNGNTAVGAAALTALVSGANNTCIGGGAGSAYTTNESNNIVIGVNPGTVGDSGVVRIGLAANKTFISGIRGVTTDNADAIAVLIDSAGQLGTVSSSIRYKENIKNLVVPIEGFMALKPVGFNYKDQSPDNISLGLIAEDVEKVFPELVIYRDGEIETVKYHELPAVFIAVIQDLIRAVSELQQEVKELKGERYDKSVVSDNSIDGGDSSD